MELARRGASVVVTTSVGSMGRERSDATVADEVFEAGARLGITP